MDLFEGFPSLTDIQHPALDKRSLRLISLSGLVYDDEALYFEISPKKYWGRLPEGKSAIGVGMPKVKPDNSHPPYHALMKYLRSYWRCTTNLYPPGYAFLLDANAEISILSGVDIPFILQMTAPRLGGVNIPDALVQVVFLLPVHHFNWQTTLNRVDLMKISRFGFDDFMTREMWPVNDIMSQSWCDMKLKKPLPEDAVIRMILTLRSLRVLLHTDKITLDLLSQSVPN